MRRKKNNQVKKHRDGDIPVGSFSDIAFLLIVFFLVATTLQKVKSVAVDMPSGQESTAKSESKTPTIKLKGDEIYFKDKSISYEDLLVTLKALKLKEAEGEDKVIMLESTTDTNYQAYYKVLSAISKMGGVVALVEVEE